MCVCVSQVCVCKPPAPSLPHLPDERQALRDFFDALKDDCLACDIQQARNVAFVAQEAFLKTPRSWFQLRPSNLLQMVTHRQGLTDFSVLKSYTLSSHQSTPIHTGRETCMSRPRNEALRCTCCSGGHNSSECFGKQVAKSAY